MKYCLLFIFMAITGLNATWAQKPTMSADVYKTINNYVIFSNDGIHALDLMWADLQALNEASNLYYETKEVEFNFAAGDFLNQSGAYKKKPKDLYKELIPAGKKNLSVKAQMQLNSIAFEMMSILEEIDKHRNNIESYLNAKEYEGDDKLKSLYDKLNRIAILYHDFKSLRDRLIWTLDEAYDAYEAPDRNTPFVKSQRLFQQLFDSCDALLKALKKDDDAAFAADKKSIHELYNRLVDNQDVNLAGLKRHSNPDKCPLTSYEIALDDIQSFIGVLDSYGRSTPTLSKIEQAYGKAYVFYPNLVSKYNRKDKGFISSYNKFIQLSNQQLLPAFEEPQWYTVVDPNEPDPELEIPETKIVTPEVVELVPVGTPTLEGFAPNNLILLLDVSSSMASEQKLPLLKKSLKYLLKLMRPEDNIAIISYSGTARTILPSTSASERVLIEKTLERLRSAGQTNIDAGIKLAYEEAKKAFIPNGNNRIILATDGQFELSNKLRKLIDKQTKYEIFLSLFYFGKEPRPSTSEILSDIANLGRGNFTHIQAANAEVKLLIEAQSVRKR